MSLIANLIKNILVRGDFTNCFTKPVSALVCAEPIVLREEGFVRTSRGDGEERGTVAVVALVVREDPDDAESDAIACEQLIRRCDWERDAEAWPYRIVGVDTGAPRFEKRDDSGRYVWKFGIDVMAVRAL